MSWSKLGGVLRGACLCLALTVVTTANVQAGDVRVPSHSVPDTVGPKGGTVPGVSLGNKSSADIWRDIKGGKSGFMSNSGRYTDKLIDGNYNACRKDQPCTEKGVGFALPIHEKMPPIQVAQGTGLTTDVVFLLLGIAGVLLGWIIYVLTRLGRTEDEDDLVISGDGASGS